MPECEICPTALSEGSKCPGGSAVSHLVLPIHDILIDCANISLLYVKLGIYFRNIACTLLQIRLYRSVCNKMRIIE